MPLGQRQTLNSEADPTCMPYLIAVGDEESASYAESDYYASSELSCAISNQYSYRIGG